VKGLRDALVLGAVLALQATLAQRIAIAGVKPDLLVAFVVYFGWMRGPVPGVIGGFTVGLIQDLDAPGPLGLNALAKTVVGFVVASGLRVHRSNVGVRSSSRRHAPPDVIYLASTPRRRRRLRSPMFLTALLRALYDSARALAPASGRGDLETLLLTDGIATCVDVESQTAWQRRERNLTLVVIAVFALVILRLLILQVLEGGRY
jgi:hypothetical protein